MPTPTVEQKLEILPVKPGCYLHKDANGTVIYVGKAINLRSRVRSYFQKSANHTPKIRRLVQVSLLPMHPIELLDNNEKLCMTIHFDWLIASQTNSRSKILLFHKAGFSHSPDESNSNTLRPPHL